MPENGDPASVGDFITRLEYKLAHKQVCDNIMENKTHLEKHDELLYGNGKTGLIMVINKMMWEKQWVASGVSILIGIVGSIIGSVVTAVILTRVM